ncbi:MAG: hypothetical protein ACPGN3_00995 [Opitutales bacterium]
MSETAPDIDWSGCTFSGAELNNLIDWQKLSFDQKLKANEDLNALFDEAVERKKKSGDAYIDPNTGNLVKPKR